MRTDDDALAARAVGGLPDQPVEPVERPRPHFVLVEHERLDVGQNGSLAEVELDHRRHVRVHGLVVGHAVAEEVRDREVARPGRVHDARAPQHRRRPEVQRVEILVVDAAVDDVDAFLAARRQHVQDVVATHEIAAFHELDTHLPREERVLEVRGVVDAGCQQHDAGIVHTRRRDRTQRLQQASRVVGHGLHAVRREQLREHVRHRAPVLHDVRDPRRDAKVVLEHAHAAVGVAHEVDAGDVHTHATGRRDAERGPMEV